jgi:uncharacterized FAD-dependent dehydrogenase
MIRISELKLKPEEDLSRLKMKAAHLLRVSPEEISGFRILRRSLDARKKPELFYVYTVGVELKAGKGSPAIGRHNNIMSTKMPEYVFPVPGKETLHHRPAVIGSGPAGLFCAYLLARNGYEPIILERGDPADIRTKKTEAFWKGGLLDPDSNVQFGEGGAGTFSDGKLNTSVKDSMNRASFIFDTFIRHGAPEEIAYDQKPHLGTDILTGILLSMRKEIEACGGKYYFRHQVTGIRTLNGKLTGLEINHGEVMDTDIAVLAPGHSARDTIRMLRESSLKMEPKAFAVGLRVEHPQRMIDLSQYGRDRGNILPPAAYKLTHQLDSGRGVYSFCMCPGGYVVNASSEPGMLCVNGMSYQKRGSKNANSAVAVTISPSDFLPFADEEYPEELSGIAFQRKLEKQAFAEAGGRIPVQLLADFRAGRRSTSFGEFLPCMKGEYDFGRVDRILPEEVSASILLGMDAFGRKIRGYDRPDAILSGVESRTSSPVRIVRNEAMESSIQGLIPAGEGAGYAGGIMSAAMDGMKAAEKIASSCSALRIRCTG